MIFVCLFLLVPSFNKKEANTRKRYKGKQRRQMCEKERGERDYEATLLISLPLRLDMVLLNSLLDLIEVPSGDDVQNFALRC